MADGIGVGVAVDSTTTGVAIPPLDDCGGGVIVGVIVGVEVLVDVGVGVLVGVLVGLRVAVGSGDAAV